LSAVCVHALLVEKERLILGDGQFSDTDRIAPEHFGRTPVG
jgi:hypothetical protein